MTMWLFRRFVVRRWFRNPVRPLLMLAAVMLATTLWSAVLRTTFSGVRSFERSLGISADNFPVIIAPQGGRLLMSEVGLCLSGLASAFDMRAIRREGARLITPSHSLPVRVVGVGGYGEGSPRSAAEMDDRTPIIIPLEIAKQLGVAQNASIVLDFDGARLGGRVQYSEEDGDGGSGAFVSVALSVLAGLSPRGALDAVLVESRAGSDPDLVRTQLTRWFQGCYRGGAPLRIETAQGRVEHGERLLGAYRFNVLIMAAMTLLVCVLLVSQATHASLLTLSRELSIVRTLGIGSAECLMIVVVEAALLGMIGAVIGITVGYPLTVEISSFLSGTAAEIYKLEMDSLRGGGLLLSEFGVVLTILAVAVVGALMGGVQALRISPNVGTRREFVHIRPLRSSWTVALAVTVLLMFAVALATVLVMPTLWGSYALVLACVVLVMGVTPLGVSATHSVVRFWRSSLISRLASGGVRMSGRAYVLAAMGAAVAITLMVALTLMVESFRATLASWADTRLQGDLFVSSVVEGGGNEGRLPASFVRDVAALQGVHSAVPYYESDTWIGERSVVVGATDLTTQALRGVYRLTDGALDLPSLAEGRACVISESAARKLAVGIGDLIEVEHREFAVQAVLQEFGTERPMVLIEDDVFLSLYPEHRPQSLIVYLRDPSMVEDVRTTVEERGRGGVIVRDQRELKDLVMYLFDRTFRVTGSVRWIVFGIGVLGLVVAALQLLWERRREVKTLFVIGVTPAQVIGWSVLEGALVSLAPFALGVIMGTVVGWALTTMVNPLSFGWTLEFSGSTAPLFFAAAFVVCVCVALVLASWLTTRRIARQTTLSDE
jgi:ABC-type antimicrobial peptide transport system permease subunit